MSLCKTGGGEQGLVSRLHAKRKREKKGRVARSPFYLVGKGGIKENVEEGGELKGG